MLYDIIITISINIYNIREDIYVHMYMLYIITSEHTP